MLERREPKFFYGWVMVVAVWLIYFLNASFPIYGGSVVNSFLAKDLAMSRAALGLGFTIFGLAQGLTAPLYAWVINKRGIRFCMVCGSVLIALGALGMATVGDSPITFVIMYGIVMGLGCGAGTGIPAQVGIVSWFKRKRALALSIVLTAGAIGGFIAAPLMNKVIASAGGHWQPAYWFIVGSSFLAAVLALFLVKNKPEDIGQVADGIPEGEEVGTVSKKAKVSRVYQTTEEWTIKEAMKTSALWLILVAVLGYMAPYYICLTHGVLNLMDHGIPAAFAALAAGMIPLFSLAGRLLAGILGDNIEPKYIFLAGLVAMLIGVLAIINASTIAHVYIYASFLGLGFGATAICMATIYGNYYGAGVYASILGTVFPFVSILGSCMPIIAGAIFDATGSYGPAFYVGVVCTVLAIVCMIFVKPPKKPQPQDLSTQV